MYKITLTELEFETIQKEMFSSPDPHVHKKMNAVLLVAQDVERQVICKHLDVKRATLVSSVKLFLAEELDGLKRNNDVRPISPLREHVGTLEKYFDEPPPHSVNEAINVIQKLTGLEYKKSFVHQFLVSLGYSFRKTGGIPAIGKQEEFKKNA